MTMNKLGFDAVFANMHELSQFVYVVILFFLKIINVYYSEDFHYVHMFNSQMYTGVNLQQVNRNPV